MLCRAGALFLPAGAAAGADALSSDALTPRVEIIALPALIASFRGAGRRDAISRRAMPIRPTA